jgi:hypothetical protein
MGNAKQDDFDEEAALEAARERSAAHHPRETLKIEHNRLLKGHKCDAGEMGAGD